MEIEKAAQGARRGAYVRRSPELKAAIVAECLAPGASVAAVALAHGFAPVTLGPRVLRAETAPLAALAALLV